MASHVVVAIATVQYRDKPHLVIIQAQLAQYNYTILDILWSPALLSHQIKELGCRHSRAVFSTNGELGCPPSLISFDVYMLKNTEAKTNSTNMANTANTATANAPNATNIYSRHDKPSKHGKHMITQ